MIVRVWRARATPEKISAYREHLRAQVLPVLQSLPGFVGAELMERVDDGEIELIVSSRWDSLEAVRGFAGDTYENAVVAPAARSVLSSYDHDVVHYDVTVECKQ